MNTYTVVLFLHVFAATTLLGGSMVAAPLVQLAARRARTHAELRTVLGLGRPLGAVNPVSSLIVMATGGYLTALFHWWGMPWIQVALVAWLTNVIVAASMVAPHMRRLGKAAATAGDGPVVSSTDVLRRSRRWTVGVRLLIANDAAVLVLMTMKPGLSGALLAIASTNVLLWSGAAALSLSLRPLRARHAASA